MATQGVPFGYTEDMSTKALTLTLPSDLDDALTEQARKRRTTPELLAVDSLRERFVAPAAGAESAESETLAEFLKGHIGVLHSSEHVPGGARMSEDCGRKLAAGLLEQHRQRR